jgi:hypothetical protein
MILDRELALIALYLLLLTYLWMGVLFFKARKKSPENPVLLAFLLIFLFFFVGRLLLSIFDFYLTIFDTTRFTEFLWWWKIGTLVHYTGLIVLCFVVERQLFEGRDKYVFFISFVASLAIMVLMPTLELGIWFAGLGILFSFFIPIGSLQLAIKNRGEIRRRALFVFVGFIIYMWAIFITVEFILNFFRDVMGWSPPVIHIFSYAGQLIGSVLFARGYL